MAKYRVRSAGLDVTIEARNHRMAAIKAIDENDPVGLGILIASLREGDSEDDEMYMTTEFVLRSMGLWAKDEVPVNDKP